MSDRRLRRGVTAVVVGGSLAGLMTALTLSRVGAAVTILERSGPVRSRGGGLLISDGLVERITGWGRHPNAPKVPTSLSGGFHAWRAIFRALYAAVDADPGVTLVHDARAVKVEQDDAAAWVTTEDGRTFRADMVIGADGHRSIVRTAVAPEHPDATFAGYIVWLTAFDEQELPPGIRGHRAFGGTVFVNGDGEVLLGGSFPSDDGATAPGDRTIGWAVYDSTHNEFLRRNGNVRGSVVHHSVTPDEITPELADELVRSAGRWPSPWKELIVTSIRAGAVLGTPISEYVPQQIANGRVAIVGDAAHVATPMTGRGFDEALDDAEVLADQITSTTRRGTDIARALLNYQKARIRKARGTVESGQQFSRRFRPAA